MSGTLFGLGLSQQHDSDGRPMSGCLLYLYAANTTTPAVAYRGPSLTAGQELPWPLVADSAGRLPAFWLADGAYRARLTDENGVVQFDEGNILAVGSGTGDIITSDVPPEAIFTTGMVMWMPENNVKAGWVRLNGQTIGNATSGANHTGTTYQALFEYLYAAFANAICPVSGGRGANALADFNASKTLTLLDLRGRAAFGLDDMGSSASNWLTGVNFQTGDKSTGGSRGGSPFIQMLRSDLPNIPLNIPAGQGSHTHTGTAPGSPSAQPAPGGNPQDMKAAGTSPLTINANTLPAMTTESLNGAVTQTALQTTPTFVVGTWHMRL